LSVYKHGSVNNNCDFTKYGTPNNLKISES